MYCSKCGAQVEEGSRFCNKCGQAVYEETAGGSESTSSKKKFATYEDLTPELREKLKPYQKHTNMACLECGYSGLMGVTETVVPWYLSLWLWLPFFGLLGLTGVGIIACLLIGAVVGMVRHTSLKKHTICPSCNKALISTEHI